MLAVSTKWCPRCGAEFIARVQVCPDCGVELGTEPPGSVATRAVADGDEPRPGESVVYELHEWSEEDRSHLERLLSSGWLPGPGDRLSIFNARDRVQEDVGAAITGKSRPGIPHVWQGTDLVVPYEEQERVEAFLDQVELATIVALDPEAPKLAYDLSDLSDEQLDLVSDNLLAEEIRHGFDDETGELVVHEADEERVEAILDAIDFPDALPVDDEEDAHDADADPLAAQEAMSDLFVAADRLRKDARDPEGMTTVLTASEVAAGLPLPYGFSEADWTRLVEAATGLAALLQQDGDDDASLAATEEAADALRTLLRPYV